MNAVIIALTAYAMVATSAFVVSAGYTLYWSKRYWRLKSTALVRGPDGRIRKA